MATKKKKKEITPLIYCGYDMLIGDESSRIKNPTAKRTEALIQIADTTEYRMLISGTPIPNDLLDIWSQWRVLDRGEEFFNNFYKFRNVFAKKKTRKSKYGHFFVEWKPIPELKAKVKEVVKENAIRWLKKDCLDLPNKVYSKIYVKLTKEQKEMHDIVSCDIADRLGIKDTIKELKFKMPQNVLAEYAKLSQITAGFLYNKEGHKDYSSEKVDTICEYINEGIENREKVILYCRFYREMDRYMELLAHHTPLKIDGRMSSSEKGEAERMYQDNENNRLIIVQVRCGIGITLNKTTFVIYASNTFSWEDRAQSEDRAHRSGTKQKVLYLDVITRNTIDERVIEILSKKQKTAEEVLNV